MIPATVEIDKAAKYAVTLSHLKHAVAVASAAVPSRTTIPTLDCIRIEQLPTGLAVEATSLDLWIRALIPESNGPASPLVIPEGKLSPWIKLLVGEDVKIAPSKQRAVLSCGRARVTLPVLAADKWPDNSVYDLKGFGLTLKQAGLARALRFAMIAVSNDADRYTLNGVQFSGDGTKLRFISTNGHCLMVYEVPYEEKFELLIPSLLIKAMLPLLAADEDTVNISYKGERILASIAAETPVFIAAPTLTGTFPQWQHVYPKESRMEISVDSQALLSSLERCILLADEKSHLVIFNFDSGTILLESSSVESGESRETVDFLGSLKSPLRLGINATYAINLLKKLSGEVIIALPETNQSPLLFKATPAEGEALGYVVMPMRV
jgi:DNA polymerase-3 subunit beta